MTTSQDPGTHPLTPEETRVRRAHLVAGAAAYLGVVALIGGELPDRLAVHFGPDGRADRLMGTPAVLLVLGLVALGIPALLLAITAAGQWWRGATARATSALVTGLTAGLVTLFLKVLWSQRGLEDATLARLEPVAALWGLTVGAVVGLAVAALLPTPLPQPQPAPADPLELAPTDRVTWFGRAVTSRAVGLTLAGALLLALLLALDLQEWWMLPLLVVLVLVAAVLSVFRVRVDRAGVSWASALGWPRGHVPMADVAGASVMQVRPGDFGGYGMRTVPGTFGLITRPGPALVITHRRSDQDRRLVITVDDALTAARVVEGLRTRDR